MISRAPPYAANAQALYTCTGDDDGPPPPRPKQPPMPRECREPTEGHGLLPDTPANAVENARRTDEWLRCLNEYKSSPAYREWEVLMARHRAAMTARKKRRDRQRDRGADDNARRQRL
eukprot:7383430-Prymnesium_polylepis.1